MPYSLRIVCGFFNVPQLFKGCETGPPAYSPYTRRLERLTICWCNYKGSTFYSVILRLWVLVRPESNSRPPASQPNAQQLSHRFNRVAPELIEGDWLWRPADFRGRTLCFGLWHVTWPRRCTQYQDGEQRVALPGVYVSLFFFTDDLEILQLKYYVKRIHKWCQGSTAPSINSVCKLYFSWRLVSNLAGKIALQFYLVLQLGGLIFFSM